MTKDRGYGDMEHNKGNFGTRDAGERRDPVCGMPVAEHTGFHSSHGGKDFYFCGSTCQQSFGRDPSRYVGEWADDWQEGRETGECGNLGRGGEKRSSGSHAGDDLNEMATEFGPTGVPGTGRSERAKTEGTYTSTSGGGGDYRSSSGHFPYSSPGAPAAHRPINSRQSGGSAGGKGGYRAGRDFGKNL